MNNTILDSEWDNNCINFTMIFGFFFFVHEYIIYAKIKCFDIQIKYIKY